MSGGYKTVLQIGDVDTWFKTHQITPASMPSEIAISFLKLVLFPSG